MNNSDLRHLYELSYEQFQPGCHLCKLLKTKIRKKLGKKISDEVAKIVKKNPYHMKQEQEPLTECPCNDPANHNNGDESTCVQGAVIKNNL